MHNLGEKLVYGANGVMEIVDIRDETVGEVSRKYYVLREIGSNSASMTFVPVDSERLVALMRPLLDKESIMKLIADAKNMPEIDWPKDNRARAERFRSIIESGDRRGMMAMIKTIYENGLKRGEDGKRNYISDEAAMRRAERLLYSEFSEVLGVSEEELTELIAASCK